MLRQFHIDGDQDSEFTIGYSSLKEIGLKSVVSPKVSTYLGPVFYLQYACNKAGSVRLSEYMKIVRYHVDLRRRFGELSNFDRSSGKLVLSETDLDEYVSTFGIPLELSPELRGFYVQSVARRIMFLFDHRRSGKVSIKRLLLENVTLSTEAFMKLYTLYLDMDIDGNGLLSKSELARYPGGLLSVHAIDRIYETFQTYEADMDFKGYLDLMYVLEHPSHPSSIRYVWKLLDVNSAGRIGEKEFLPFHTAILKPFPAAPYKPVHLFHETMDILNITSCTHVTLSQLLSADSKSATSVMNMLIDTHAFYLYDNREALLLTAMQKQSA